MEERESSVSTCGANTTAFSRASQKSWSNIGAFSHCPWPHCSFHRGCRTMPAPIERLRSRSKPWLQADRGVDDGLGRTSAQHCAVRRMTSSEAARSELDEGRRAWMQHKKEASWRLKRLELQLESEKV